MPKHAGEEDNMPQPFLNCVKAGGRVRTKELSGGRYIHICFLNGKSYAGEVKQKKGAKQKYISVLKGR